MKKVTCENGHFYDADRFESCPICGRGSSETLPKLAVFESEETVPLPPSSVVDERASTAWISPEEMCRIWEDDVPREPPEQQKFTEENALKPPQREEVPGSVDELAPTMWIEPDPSFLAVPEESAQGEVEASEPEGINELPPMQEGTPELEEAEKPIPAQAKDFTFAQVDELVPTQKDELEKVGESILAQIGEPTPMQVDEFILTQKGESELSENGELIRTQAEAPAPTQADGLVPTQMEQPECKEEVAVFTQEEESVSTFCEASSAAEKPARSESLPLVQAVAMTDAMSIPAVSPELLPQKLEAPASYPAILPVGWLVGLSGENRGRLFPCRSGRNRIGRSLQMDIAIPEESSVDLDTHAQIIYEPKKRQFFLQAGNGNGLSYLNDGLVFTHEELHAYDRITLGDVEFIFLPLCGESFDWDTNTCGE